MPSATFHNLFRMSRLPLHVDKEVGTFYSSFPSWQYGPFPVLHNIHCKNFVMVAAYDADSLITEKAPACVYSALKEAEALYYNKGRVGYIGDQTEVFKRFRVVDAFWSNWARMRGYDAWLLLDPKDAIYSDYFYLCKL